MIVLGLDLGGTRLKALWWDTETRAAIEREVIEMANSTLPEFLTATTSIVSKRAVSSIGIGIPGTLDRQRARVMLVPNLTGWGIVPLKSLLEERFSVPVALENDANLAALAEYEAGAGRNTAGIVLLTLGTGIGGGVVIGGDVYTGALGGGIELGHFCIDVNGPACNCGSTGCLEVYCGRDGLIRRGTALDASRSNWTPLDWSTAAEQGDPLALTLWNETGTFIGLALAAYVNIFHPERILLAGGIAKAGEKLLEPIRQTVQRRAFKGLTDGLQIQQAEIGEWAGAVGAALLAARNI